MVYRVYVEKKPGLDNEARGLLGEIRELLQIDSVTKVRLLNRYDGENLSKELFDYCKTTVFSEPQIDWNFETLEEAIEFTFSGIGEITSKASSPKGKSENSTKSNPVVFAVEYLPGQFDQRADSAAQCIQLISKGERPDIRTARVYMLYGSPTEAEIEAIKAYVINPVEAREASLEPFSTLKTEYPVPEDVVILDGFRDLTEEGLTALIEELGLAMDLADISFCREYFLKEARDPSLTEIKMIDTYWSDHCRHTTFLTTLDKVTFEDELLQKAYDEYVEVRRKLGRTKPVNLMDLGTIAARYLKAEGKLPNLDESEEINACTVKIKVNRFDSNSTLNSSSNPNTKTTEEDWLLLFKNETHNHPTEIEPFGGAATCLGGAIRDPLSGRSYVYAAMRVTGAANPLTPVKDTLKGKLPQRTIVTGAAAGYSSYGNQIGLTTGQVNELYHPGYVAKRMEIGAVLGAAPAANVIRETPLPGDLVILLGGKTGRDGCGGATGSSKSHTLESLESCGAEVQKGNAPEERKLQRLFRNEVASRMIKRCNDFGAGGVSVAIGELAPGLSIDLDAVPKKYEGLDGTELAISESQERMAVVIAAENVKAFIDLAAEENLEAVPVAKVTEEARLVMHWRGKTIVDICREFLDSNGAEKHIEAVAGAPMDWPATGPVSEALKSEYGADGDNSEVDNAEDIGFSTLMKELAGNLNICSDRGLSERFDSTIGCGTVLLPFGGKYQRTPIQAMVHKIPVEKGDTDICSLMAWGYNPFISEKSPYHGAYLAVVESLCKLVAAGAAFEDVYLSFQEYFERLGKDSRRWGKPLSALLGAFMAQKDFGVAAIGGKDSMSGSFEDLHVPPTLVSFAVTTENIANIISPEFKGPGHSVVHLKPANVNGLPDAESVKEAFELVLRWIKEGKVLSAYTPTYGGVAEAILKMSIGNEIGFNFALENQIESKSNVSISKADAGPDSLNGKADLNTSKYKGIFEYSYGSFVIELAEGVTASALRKSGFESVVIETLGMTTEKKEISFGPSKANSTDTISLAEILEIYEAKLEPIYPMNPPSEAREGSTVAPAVAREDGQIPTLNYDVTDSETKAGEASPKTGSRPKIGMAKPKVLIPVFPGTNCEYDSAKAVRAAGGEPEIIVIRNLSAAAISESISFVAKELSKSQILFIPGGFSGGDEPDGSGKFITAFLRNPEIREEIEALLEQRDGLICGICNGFQALIKLGLVPFGKIMDMDDTCPTLTYNKIGRHQSKLVRTRVASNLSPWLSKTRPGEIYTVPISHGEGRFLISDELLKSLAEKGQIATQYVDLEGRPTEDIQFNPNGSTWAVEGITSPDGRVFGKMGHAERVGRGLYKNVGGNFDLGMFEGAMDYFK